MSLALPCWLAASPAGSLSSTDRSSASTAGAPILDTVRNNALTNYTGGGCCGDGVGWDGDDGGCSRWGREGVFGVVGCCCGGGGGVG